MEKRLLLAIGLSLLVLLSWSVLSPKPQVIAPESVTNIVSTTKVEEKALEPVNVPEKTILFQQEDFDVSFNEPLATIKDLTFKKYNNFQFPLYKGFLLDQADSVFKKESETKDSITFVYSDNIKKITKKYYFYKQSYTMGLEINIRNLTSADLKIRLPLVAGEFNFSPKNIQARYQDVTVATQEKVMHVNAQKNQQFAGLKFISLRDQYFCLITEPKQGNYTGFVNKSNNSTSIIGLESNEFVIPANSQIGQLFSVYIGPQDLRILNSVKPDWTSVIYYGTFDFISQILLQTLEVLNKVFHNWGWAIICLSILVYLILYPLSIKQMRSMKEMQAIQPKVEALRKEFKDNPQKMNKEIMQLYKEHKVNPFGGCLPLILQMPIFFALYNALMRSIVLRGAKFLWIKDLSEPDRLFTLPITLPVISNEFNILPIVMALGMFVQQKISASSASGVSSEQQKIMLIIMPVMFGFIFYRMPSGLVLYWLINSILMLIFQLKMNRAR